MLATISTGSGQHHGFEFMSERVAGRVDVEDSAREIGSIRGFFNILSGLDCAFACAASRVLND